MINNIIDRKIVWPILAMVLLALPVDVHGQGGAVDTTRTLIPGENNTPLI